MPHRLLQRMPPSSPSLIRFQSVSAEVSRPSFSNTPSTDHRMRVSSNTGHHSTQPHAKTTTQTLPSSTCPPTVRCFPPYPPTMSTSHANTKEAMSTSPAIARVALPFPFNIPRHRVRHSSPPWIPSGGRSLSGHKPPSLISRRADLSGVAPADPSPRLLPSRSPLLSPNLYLFPPPHLRHSVHPGRVFASPSAPSSIPASPPMHSHNRCYPHLPCL